VAAAPVVAGHGGWKGLTPMRVLFTTWAWRSHLYSLVPLAWACRTAGHDVLVASQPRLLEEIIRTGLPAATVGHDVDALRMVRGYLLPAAEGSRAPGTRGPRVLEMVLAQAESMVDGVVELVKTWRADVVVFEPTALAGPIAAAAAGVPAVRHLYGIDLMLRAAPVLPDLLAPLATRHRAGALDPFGTMTIDPVPAGLQLPTDYARLPVQYVPFNGSGSVPAQPPVPSGRPGVCVTWGHTIASLDPARFLLPAVLDAISTLDVDIVAAVSAEQRALLGVVPQRVRVVVDAPLHHLLGDVDLVVGHGGAGTVLTALHHGLPLLLVPQLPDHAGHAERVLAAGAGAVLTVEQATPQRLREEVQRLLGDGSRRAAAGRLQREMRAAPAPAAVAAELAATVGVAA
jgi:UDP:flavonoid glycosyltransferase YjiC (YdhE family)